MKKRIYITLTCLAVCLLSAVTVFTACSSDEVSNTPTLSVFGPSPVLRGGVVKFMGTNLDKVTSVVLANNLEITDITHTSSTEISITIPQDAQPGLVTLKAPSGDIKTKTPLTFSEPISIDKYTTTSVKAGDVFTIEGDYLNLIAQVIFTDGAVVDSAKFISQTRKKIEVYVPKTAKTGKVAVSNGATIPVLVYTADVATITNPTTITGIAPTPVKPGGSLTISGTNMDLIKTVILPDGNKIDSAAIAINTAKTQITVQVPSTAKEGAVKVVTYSGAEITASQSMTLVGPAITSVSPMLVKNGATLTVTGTDLDLVTGATFAGSVAGTIKNQTATSLELTVPMTAVDGVITFATKSGKTATSEAITLVKPTFTSITPLSLTAGETVTITGTDLDLVRKVTFVGGLSVAVNPSVGTTSIDVVVPLAASGTGSITFETVNGVNVASTDQLTIIKSTTPAITGLTSVVRHGALMTITGKNLNYVESVYFQDNVKAVLYGVRTETSIEVYVPETAKAGTVTLTLNSFDGNKIVSPTFKIPATDPITANTVMIMDYEAHGGHNGSWDNSWSGNSEIKTVDGNTYLRMTGNLDSGANGIWIMNCNHQSDGALAPVVNDITAYVIKVDVKAETDFIPTNAQFQLVFGNKWVWVGSSFLPLAADGKTFTTGGDWTTITLDPIVLGLSGKLDMSSGTNGLYLSTGTIPGTGLCFDNLRLEPR